jgi:hypothetical protein
MHGVKVGVGEAGVDLDKRVEAAEAAPRCRYDSSERVCGGRASRHQTQRPGRQQASGLSVHDRLRTAGRHPLPVADTSTTEGREPNA